MINYLTGTDLWLSPDLARTMFTDRATQFSKRLGWPVSVDKHGYERDQYDQVNPIYVIVADDHGRHAGSMRLLPTTGATMINDVFASSLDDGPISDPSVWECTRFCLSPAAEPRSAAKLFASAGRLMQEFDVQSLVAVFDRSMLRKYRISGIPPEILGAGDVAGASVMTGRWQFSLNQLSDLMRLAALDPLECELALANSPLLQGPDRRYA
jgi:acyl homoserine lactone synthase